MSSSEPEAKARVQIPLWLLVLCHLLIAAGGGALVFAYFRYSITLTWPLLLVVAMTLLPVLLPVLGFYLGEVQGAKFNTIGIQGIRDAKRQPAGGVATEGATGPRQATPAAPHIPPTPQSTYQVRLFSSEELKVLRTLWKFQMELMGASTSRRWGFRVSVGQHDFAQYEKGRSGLIEKGLVEPDGRDLIFLTDAGLELCRRHDVEIKFGEIWTRFEAA